MFEYFFLELMLVFDRLRLRIYSLIHSKGLDVEILYISEFFLKHKSIWYQNLCFVSQSTVAS